MFVLDYCNEVLRLCGEQPLLSTTGNLGALVRSAINTSLLMVAQETRASVFETLVTMTATNDDYMVSAGTLPESVIQVYDVWLENTSTAQLIKLERQSLQYLGGTMPYYSYEVIGNQLFLNRSIVRPANVKLKCLSVPWLPLADDALVTIPDVMLPAIRHGAASIVLTTYVDDLNAASVHQRMSETMIAALRNQYGVTRGRGSFSMVNNNNRWSSFV